VVELSGIHLYPVKSCRGIAASAWPLDRFGLWLDRAFMVVDGAGRFLTQREQPRLARVETALEESALLLRAAGIGEQRVPLHGAAGERVAVKVWYHAGEGLDQGAGPAAFLSDLLGCDARLVRIPPEHDRRVSPRHSSREAYTAFSDGYPLLLLSQASLAALNQRLSEPLPMNRFRPNLVFSSSEPHAEDGWKRIRLGTLELEIAKPCERCAVTTTDQESGERSSSEPLRTLALYRRQGGGVLFGQNAVHQSTGRLAVGTPVQVLATQPPPRFD
jgi:uncharacterized protein YcbX